MIKKFENYIKEANGIRDEYSKVGVHNYYNDNKDVYVNPHLENIHLVLDWVLNKISIKSFIDLSCGNGEVTSYLKEKGINDGIGTDPYFNLIYKQKTDNECLKLSFEDIAIKGINLKKQSIICSYALHLCPESYFNQLLYNLSISSEYFILISPSKYPVITDNYFELIDETIINRTHCKIFKSKNSLNESLLDKISGPSKKQVEADLKKQYETDKINIFDYYKKTNELNIEGPSKEQVETDIKKQYETGKINIFNYIKLSKEYNIEGPPKEQVETYIKKQYKIGEINIFVYYKFSKEYNIQGPKEIDLYKTLGLTETFDSSEEFINELFNNIKILEDGDEIIIRNKRKNKNIIEHTLKFNYLYINYKITSILNVIFNMTENESKIFISEYLHNNFNWIKFELKKINIIYAD